MIDPTNISSGDWIALYGAVLASLIVVVASCNRRYPVVAEADQISKTICRHFRLVMSHAYKSALI
jgi:hypothetical protein